jgi:hypothetical protein
MAVSGKTAAPHLIPYFLDGDKPPHMGTVTKAMADQTHARLDAIAPKQIVGVAKKQLLIANASGVVTAVTASGDVTNDESGVFTIGANKLTTAMLQSASVTRAKLAAAVMQTKRVTLGGDASTVELTWATEFADTEYTVFLTVQRAGAGGVPITIREKTKSKIVAGATLLTGDIVHGVAFHD